MANTHVCPECKEKFSTVQVMAMHRSNVHGIKGTSRSSEQLRRKQQQLATTLPHTDEQGRNLRCDCGYIAKTWNGLGVHKATVHKIPSTKTHKHGAFQCPECPRSFGSTNGLAKHRAKMHGVLGTSKSAHDRYQRIERQAKEKSLVPSSQNAQIQPAVNGQPQAAHDTDHRLEAAATFAAGRVAQLLESIALQHDVSFRALAPLVLRTVHATTLR